MGRCPTYGSCKISFRKCPTSKYCIECGEDERYKIVFHDNDILDSVTLAKPMRKRHEPAKANCKQAWLRTPMMHVGVDQINLALQRNRTLMENEQKERRYMVYNLFDHRLDQTMVN